MARTRGRPHGATNLPADEVVRKDVLAVYRKLGGRKFLLEFAKAQPLEFVKQCLAKVAQPPKAAQQPAAEAAALSDLEGARRVAFLLSRAMHASNEIEIDAEVIGPEPEPAAAPSWMQKPEEEQPRLPYEPRPQRVAKPGLEPTEGRDLIGDIPKPTEPHLFGDTGRGYYRGSPAEHGGARREPAVITRREKTVVEKLRRQRGG